MRDLRRWRGPLSTLVVGLVVALGPVSVAAASPADPAAGASSAAPSDTSDAALGKARAAVASRVTAVAGIEVQLAQQSADRDAKLLAAATAGEAYLRADEERKTAEVAAKQATKQLASADVQAEGARRTLVAIALQAARSGGSIDGVQAFLSADGFEEVVQRSAVLSLMGTKADRAVQQFRAATIVANALKGRADDAVAQRLETAAAAQDALKGARRAQAASESAVAAATEQRAALIVQLAAARNTTAKIERARQDELDAQQAARESAAARAQWARSATPAEVAAAAASSANSGYVRSGPRIAAPLGSGRTRGTAAQGLAAVTWAGKHLGLPYQWGATGPFAYDCSGLTMRSWQAAGVNLNRTSRDQYRQILKINYEDLRPGDLIFWGDDPGDAGSIFHVAMWVGNGQIIEAPRPGVNVRMTPITGRWARTMPYAGRP
ncbi:NlpC/P60 family protein [Pengzhenrongella sp.]|jgi:cell wall-associated NlpC family hydrolase|uniref:C40 family peptidase n=1 Tax=Pengzhenrongella sp. TaxID=2888820 RepID=UPI002F95734F